MFVIKIQDGWAVARSSKSVRRVFGERALHKGLQNMIEARAEESDKADVRRERFVGSTFWNNTNRWLQVLPSPNGSQPFPSPTPTPPPTPTAQRRFTGYQSYKISYHRQNSCQSCPAFPTYHLINQLQTLWVFLHGHRRVWHLSIEAPWTAQTVRVSKRERHELVPKGGKNKKMDDHCMGVTE